MAGAQIAEKDYATGFGLIYGEGRTQEGANSKRFGFTTRRIKDKDRIGSLALIYEEHENGVPFELLDQNLTEESVQLRYRSVYAELKRYFPFAGNVLLFWGLRGGFSRIDGTVSPPDQEPREFESDQVAPLWLLALPLALEHPGFLLLAFLDGAAVGMTLDLLPERLWLEYQIGATLIPNHRDEFFVVDELTIISQTLQLVLVF
jgi:hypothetical protein